MAESNTETVSDRKNEITRSQKLAVMFEVYKRAIDKELEYLSLLKSIRTVALNSTYGVTDPVYEYELQFDRFYNALVANSDKPLEKYDTHITKLLFDEFAHAVPEFIK